MLHPYLSAALAFLPVALSLQECYVCLSDVYGDLEYQFPEEILTVCEKGHDPPARQCPPNYKGCLTQFNEKAKSVMRSCAELAITGCQRANNINYCYCEGNLCNNQSFPDWGEKKSSSDTTTESDDEDMSEGSGSVDGPKSGPLETTPSPSVKMVSSSAGLRPFIGILTAPLLALV